MVDTGAGLNLLSARIAPQDTKDSKYSQIMLACKNTRATVVGEVKLRIKIRHAMFDVTCCVVEGLGHDIILGSPFLLAESAFIDFRRHCLYVGRDERQTVYWSRPPTKNLNTIELSELRA